jgi:hypothetical protein
LDREPKETENGGTFIQIVGWWRAGEKIETRETLSVDRMSKLMYL